MDLQSDIRRLAMKPNALSRDIIELSLEYESWLQDASELLKSAAIYARSMGDASASLKAIEAIRHQDSSFKRRLQTLIKRTGSSSWEHLATELILRSTSMTAMDLAFLLAMNDDNFYE